jgi:methyl acetate hydrolase
LDRSGEEGDGVWATQLLPFYDPKAIAAYENFERAVYASL